MGSHECSNLSSARAWCQGIQWNAYDYVFFSYFNVLSENQVKLRLVRRLRSNLLTAYLEETENYVGGLGTLENVQCLHMCTCQRCGPMASDAQIWFIGVALGISAIIGSPAVALTPTSYLQDFTIVGAAGTLTVTTLPVQTATGSFVYWDMTILLNADNKGNLTLAPGYPKFQKSVPFIVSNFEAGTYAASATIENGKDLITVSGPGVGPEGTTIWSLATAKGADSCTVPVSATWYTGPIVDNPLAARLKKDGITSAAYSYGLVGISPPFSCSDGEYFPFEQGALIGVSQTEGELSIVSFTYDGTDSKTPIAQITYSLLP